MKKRVEYIIVVFGPLSQNNELIYMDIIKEGLVAHPIIGKNTGNAGKGRPRGSPNKVNASLKEMILGALHDAGGKSWLARQAQENPAAFMALLAKLLPLELKQESAEPEPLTIRVVGGLPDNIGQHDKVEHLRSNPIRP